MRDPMAEALENAGVERTQGLPVTQRGWSQWLESNPVQVRHVPGIYSRQTGQWHRPKQDRVTMLLEHIAEGYSLTISDLKGRSRVRYIVHARQAAMYALRMQLRLTLAAIGRILGGRDHTTALHGIRVHAERNGLPRPEGDA